MLKHAFLDSQGAAFHVGSLRNVLCLSLCIFGLAFPKSCHPFHLLGLLPFTLSFVPFLAPTRTSPTPPNCYLPNLWPETTWHFPGMAGIYHPPNRHSVTFAHLGSLSSMICVEGVPSGSVKFTSVLQGSCQRGDKQWCFWKLELISIMVHIYSYIYSNTHLLCIQ